jgi:hypothetical protein
MAVPECKSLEEGEIQMSPDETLPANSLPQIFTNEPLTVLALDKKPGSRPGRHPLGFCPPSSPTAIMPRQVPNPAPEVEPEVVAKPRRTRVRLSDALRKQGVDEHALAEIYAEVIEKLKCRSDGANVEKLLIEVLKECSRLLEKEGSSTQTGGPMPPIRVIHHVARPERGPHPSGDNTDNTDSTGTNP